MSVFQIISHVNQQVAEGFDKKNIIHLFLLLEQQHCSMNTVLPIPTTTQLIICQKKIQQTLTLYIQSPDVRPLELKIRSFNSVDSLNMNSNAFKKNQKIVKIESLAI